MLSWVGPRACTPAAPRALGPRAARPEAFWKPGGAFHIPFSTPHPKPRNTMRKSPGQSPTLPLTPPPSKGKSECGVGVF